MAATRTARRACAVAAAAARVALRALPPSSAPRAGLAGLRRAVTASRSDADAAADAAAGGGPVHIVAQPIVSLPSAAPIGYELLARFPNGAAPDAVFRAAHATGAGVRLEARTAGVALAAADRHLPEAVVSINVSPAAIVAGGLVALRPRGPVVVELTEHEPVADYARLRTALGSWPVAVDDAGAGYSSLRHAHRLRPAWLKLDRVWTRALPHDPAAVALVRGLVEFADALGAQLVAEGVETREQLEAVRGLGVPLAQGYHIGAPQPLAAAPAVVG